MQASSHQPNAVENPSLAHRIAAIHAADVARKETHVLRNYVSDDLRKAAGLSGLQELFG